MGKKKTTSRSRLVSKIMIWILTALVLIALTARLIHVFKNHV
ncbi:MAG TPA: hypothetical protein PK325_01340 [Cyclobacteriaceae bacterium]|nr:hypothetical protein [Cyclobacteriaceae bacterium]HMV88303.1 hypothetical protein [Cyclobacteriaceae bacterium]HMX00728.1 hypothetical protein [Cyclobacteriaceae bacterium]HMX49397.1 hypothetical protein [Cyclobacteriaceae bacterium]HMY93531.1 hypothetical protein [Cyclobacteriaceae bacterium]